MSLTFCSNVLYKQPLESNKDIFVSFIIERKKASLDVLLLQSGDKLLLQNGDFLQIQWNMGVDGFGIFLLDANVPILTGGGSGAGLGLITDSTTSSLSAVSGMFLTIAYDEKGAFGLSGGVNQFQTGSTTPTTNSLVVRKLSTFEYVDSHKLTETSTFVDDWDVFRVAFKNNMQQIVYYSYENDNYTPYATFNTGISSFQIPERVRVGLTWSGNFPVKVKNIAINATVDT